MSDVPGLGRKRLLRGLGALVLALGFWLGAAAFLLLRDPGGAPPGLVDAGFDGIHYDIEPIQDGDAGFLVLLEATRAALPPGTPLSVATPHFRPPLMPPVDPFTRFWRADYYRQVASRCDQVAYMGYDSMMPTSGLYERFMRYQVRAMAPNVAGELLIGVPTYDEPTASHMAGVETVESGLRGARLGGYGQGVAIYADWTTAAEEWEAFRAARD